MNFLNKNVILSAALIVGMGLTSCKNETKQEAETTTEVTKDLAVTNLSFGVRGNCSMCKTTIEKAANSVAGVSSANWDVAKKKVDVSFDETKTDAMAIHKAIAAAGYDTEQLTGDLTAYENLPACCKFEKDMKMNQTGEVKHEDHSGHNH